MIHALRNIFNCVSDPEFIVLIKKYFVHLYRFGLELYEQYIKIYEQPSGRTGELGKARINTVNTLSKDVAVPTYKTAVL